MIKSIKKKYLRKKKPKKIKGRYFSKKQKGGTKKSKYISKKYKKRKYISKKKKGGSGKSVREREIAAAAEGASFGAVKAVTGCNSASGSSATSGSKPNSGVVELSQDIKKKLETTFEVYDGWTEANFEQNLEDNYDDFKTTLFTSIGKSQICNITEDYDMGQMFSSIKGILNKLAPNLKEMMQREFFNQEKLDEECISSGILSKEIIQELLVIIYQNVDIKLATEENRKIFDIKQKSVMPVFKRKRNRTLPIETAIEKYNNETIKTNIVKILEAIDGSDHTVVKKQIVDKAIEIISGKTDEEKKKICEYINKLYPQLSNELITKFFGDMKECNPSMLKTVTKTAQQITDWFTKLFPGDNDNAVGKFTKLTLALNELKELLETHKQLLEPASAATNATASAANAPATPAADTQNRTDINAKLEEILGLIPEKSEQPEPQDEKQPEQPEEPDEIKNLRELINKLQPLYSTEVTETTEGTDPPKITAEELNPKITELETLIGEITNEDVDA